MAGNGTLILASDYNTIQSNVALILGSGSSDYGYGQAVSSSQVSANAKISVSQWNNLRNDMLRCIQHQTNRSYSNYIVSASATRKIFSDDYDIYKAVSDVLGPNRLVLPPGAGQSNTAILPNYGEILAGQSSIDTINTAQRTTAWNGVITHSVTVNFPTSTIYSGTSTSRFFFNTGGRIQFTASRTGGNAGSKNQSWTTLLSNMGTIYFDYTSTTCSNPTGSGITTTNIGFYDLTTSDQTIFTKALTVAESYYPNKYSILARVNNTTTRDQVIFTIRFADDSGQPNPPWGTDENVDGTLTSTVQTYRATGDQVSIPIPTSPASTL